MKSTVSYHGILEKPSCCRIFNTKYLALMSGIYTLNISILLVLIFGWQINVNFKRYQELGDVYYGIQIAQIAVIATQFSMAILSVVLIAGIHTVYSMSLKDHIVKALAMWTVIRYHNLLRSGATWKVNKNIVEL